MQFQYRAKILAAKEKLTGKGHLSAGRRSRLSFMANIRVESSQFLERKISNEGETRKFTIADAVAILEITSSISAQGTGYVSCCFISVVVLWLAVKSDDSIAAS